MLGIPNYRAILLPIQVQQCGHCKRFLAIEEFSPSHRGSRGHWCRSCARDYARGEFGPAAKHPKRLCDFCEKEFRPKQVNAIFCGRRCKDKAKNAAWAADLAASKPRRTCEAPECGIDITQRRSDTKYCSDKCAQKARITPELRRKYRLAHKYGITPEDYDRMVIDQGNMCALCDSPEPGTKHGFWHIDHCHSTGVLRKLLCSTCNTGLGSFYDNPDVLRRAADYIEAHRPD